MRLNNITNEFISMIMATISSFYGWASFYMGKPFVWCVIFMLLINLFMILRIFQAVGTGLYLCWIHKKQISKLKEESRVKMEEKDREHQNAMELAKTQDPQMMINYFLNDTISLIMNFPQSLDKQKDFDTIHYRQNFLPTDSRLNMYINILKSYDISNPTQKSKKCNKTNLRKI